MKGIFVWFMEVAVWLALFAFIGVIVAWIWMFLESKTKQQKESEKI